MQNFLGNTGVTVQGLSNNYSGNWIVNSGRLTGTGDGSLGTGSITVAPGSTLEVMYDIQSPGVLTLQGSDAVMVLHQNCKFGAAIIDGTALRPLPLLPNAVLQISPFCRWKAELSQRAVFGNIPSTDGHAGTRTKTVDAC